MAPTPLTDLQKNVLSQIFRDRSAGPRSIALALEVKVGIVLKTISQLRQKLYIVHHQPPSCFGGNGPVYRPILTTSGRPVCDLEPAAAEQQIADYLRTHKVKKLPAGRAHGTYKSEHWDREL